MVFDLIEELKKDRKAILPGRVVAELKFGFWVGMLNASYDATLWRTVLYKAFLGKGGKPRNVVHGRFNAIRRFRSRVAHHEPIFERQLIDIHAEVIDAIGWMCRETAAWALHHSRVEETLTTAAK